MFKHGMLRSGATIIMLGASTARQLGIRVLVGEVHKNAPLRDCHITDTFPLPSPSHKGIVRA